MIGRAPYQSDALYGFYACASSMSMPRRFLMDAALHGVDWHAGLGRWVADEANQHRSATDGSGSYALIAWFALRYPGGMEHWRGKRHEGTTI